MSDHRGGSRLHRALEELQEHFLIAKVAEVEGRGNYAFIWDTFRRWMPQAVAQAQRISSGDAAAAILRGYLRIVGAASVAQIADLFRWPPGLIQTALDRTSALPATVDGADWWTLPDLLRPLEVARRGRLRGER